MVTSGGEVAFVSRMIEESLVLQDRVQWYTSMLGKHSSVEILVNKLREKGVSNYGVTEFVQGNKTRRWGIAWSFEDKRPKVEVARGLSSLAKGILPFPSEHEFMVKDCDASTIGQFLNNILSQLPLKWMWKPVISTGVGFCQKAVWSRAFRRLATKDQDMTDDDEGTSLQHFPSRRSKSYGIMVASKISSSGFCKVMGWQDSQYPKIIRSFLTYYRRHGTGV